MSVNFVQVTDDFTRADENPLVGGPGWAGGYTSMQSLQVVSNACQSVSAAGLNAVEGVTVEILGANQWASLGITTFTGGGANKIGVCLRMASPVSLDCYCFRALINDGAGHTSAISRFSSAGGFSDLVTESATTWSGGDTILGEANGTTLNLYRNGSLLLTVVDSGLTANGRVGILIASVGTTNTIGDNFQGGIIVPGAVFNAR